MWLCAVMQWCMSLSNFVNYILCDFFPHITLCMWLCAVQLRCFVFSSHFRIHLSHINTTIRQKSWKTIMWWTEGVKCNLPNIKRSRKCKEEKMGWLWSSLRENKIKYRLQCQSCLHIKWPFYYFGEKINDSFGGRSELDGYVFTCTLFHSCLWTVLL